MTYNVPIRAYQNYIFRTRAQTIKPLQSSTKIAVSVLYVNFVGEYYITLSRVHIAKKYTKLEIYGQSQISSSRKAN